MAVFSYTAVDRGDLAAGHSAGTSYQIEIPLTDWSPSDREKKVVRRSLSGIPHQILHHRTKLFRFATLATDDATLLAHLEELFSSVAGGEPFSIDVLGTIASPNNPINVVMSGSVSSPRSNQTELSYRGQVERI